MKYKLVALDLDGTLLDNSSRIPAENIKMIKQLSNQGVNFVVVSGRADLMIREHVETLGIKAPVLACNGATMRDLTTNEFYYIKDIAKQPLRELYGFFQANKIYPHYYSTDIIYSCNPDENINNTQNPFASHGKCLSDYMKVKIIADVEEIMREDVKVTKVVYVTYDAEKIVSLQKKINKIRGIEALRTARHIINVVNAGVSKGKALLEYAAGLGINKDEIVAMGDGQNDFSMLSAVGFPVSLENSEDCLKEIAKMITASNDDAGVAKALSIIFGQELT